MKTHNLKLHVLMALMASASVFHVGCGDDDDNATPSNTGGKSSGTGGATTGTGGKSTGTGGSGGTGGTSTGTGGKSTGTGGIDGTSGAGNNTSAGSGGEPVVGGGAGGVGTAGMPGTDGGAAGSGGAGGAGMVLPPCDSGHYDGTKECYLECEPNSTASSEEFLNRCSEAGANCTPFDNTTLDKLVNGVLPPLP